MSHPPLKRHVSLQPLSRDHFLGLRTVHRILDAAAGGENQRRRTLANLLEAWDRHLAEHFADEERLLPMLIPTLAMSQQMFGEHGEFRRLMEEGRTMKGVMTPDTAWLRRAAELLEKHIRWEERVLFPAIQNAANSEQLAELEKDTLAIEHSRPRRVRG